METYIIPTLRKQDYRFTAFHLKHTNLISEDYPAYNILECIVLEQYSCNLTQGCQILGLIFSFNTRLL